MLTVFSHGAQGSSLRERTFQHPPVHRAIVHDQDAHLVAGCRSFYGILRGIRVGTSKCEFEANVLPWSTEVLTSSVQPIRSAGRLEMARSSPAPPKCRAMLSSVCVQIQPVFGENGLFDLRWLIEIFGDGEHQKAFRLLPHTLSP